MGTPRTRSSRKTAISRRAADAIHGPAMRDDASVPDAASWLIPLIIHALLLTLSAVALARTQQADPPASAPPAITDTR